MREDASCCDDSHVQTHVVVVGAGLFGTSIAFQLARRGIDVVLVERDVPGAGDSGLSFAMVRRHYSNESVARLAMRGTHVIQHWQDEVGCGDSGFVRTGYLLTVDAERREALEENVRRLVSWGLDTRVVEPDEIAEIEPLLALDGIAAAAYEPDAGFADAKKMALSWFAGAVRHGAVPLLGTAVTGFLLDGDRVRGVETDQGPIEGGVVVNAAGGWGPALARTAGVDVPVALRRLQVSVVRQPPDRPQARVTFSDMVSNLVLRPDRACQALVVAYQPPTEYDERDDCPVELDPDYEVWIRKALRERFPSYADAEWLGGWAGAYDYTPDWNPIVGWAPGVEGLYLALGWSGHGFKLPPAVGEVVAAEIEGTEAPVDVSELDPGRFERGELLRLAYGPSARA
jgi:glycine/D-amino acid oxidase-like deaminating enzyme